MNIIDWQIPVINKDTNDKIVCFFQSITGMTKPKYDIEIGLCDVKSSQDWPKNALGYCTFIKSTSFRGEIFEGYILIIIDNRLSFDKFVLTLTHELFHAHETSYTLKQYKSASVDYNSYYNCPSEVLARAYSDVYSPAIREFLMEIKSDQIKLGIKRKTGEELCYGTKY